MRPLWPPPMTMASYLRCEGVGMRDPLGQVPFGSGCLAGWVEERQPGHMGADQLVAMVDGHFEVDPGANGRKLGLDPGDCDVTLQDR